MARSGGLDLARTLTVFVADLFGPDRRSGTPGPEPRLPGLEWLLARATRLPPALPRSFEPALFQLFGVSAPDAGDLPVAAVTRIHDSGRLDHDWWLRADPVCLEPHGDGLVLQSGTLLDLTGVEAQTLAGAIARDYAAQGWRLEASDPLRWYLHPSDPPRQLLTTPLPDVAGRDIAAFLPHGADGPVWRRRLNEVQLLLHAQPANERRRERGLRPVNSLWFWGGGRAPEPGPPRWNGVWTADPLGGGLARLTQVPVQPLPGGLDRWLTSAAAGDYLVIWHPGGDTGPDAGPAWRERLAVLEREWFAPAAEALRRNRLATVTIAVAGRPSFRVTRFGRRRWWCRRRPLTVYR